MSRQLIALNAALVLVALLAVAYVVREFRAPAPPPARRTTAPAPAVVNPPATPEAAPPGGYNVVASRNLFSPNRSEAPPTPVNPAAAAPPQPKPNLFGVLLRDGAPVAYLEDPTTKRVAGYRLGDAIAGGTVKQIGADHVVLNRPEGDVNVRLRDPSKPRPAAPPVAGAPGGPPLPGGATPPVASAPGVDPRTAVTPPQPQPGAVMQNPQGGATILPRRPLPPNLLRRLPPPATDAQPQN